MLLFIRNFVYLKIMYVFNKIYLFVVVMHSTATYLRSINFKFLSMTLRFSELNVAYIYC